MTIKTRDLRPCASCGGKIAPVFYQLKVQLRQMLIDYTAVNEVLGIAQVLGGNLQLGEIMSPNRPAAIETGGYSIDKEFYICLDCAADFKVRLIDLLLECEKTAVAEEATDE